MRRLSIDIGGTFTDLFAYDDTTGKNHGRKGSDDADRPSLGVINVIEKAG
jgi:N-methylhydantoinase A